MRRRQNVDELIKLVTYKQTEVHGRIIYAGSCQDSYALEQVLPESYQEAEEWSDNNFRRVWISHQERSTATYCEGDVHVTKHDTEAEFVRELEEAAAFYRTPLLCSLTRVYGGTMDPNANCAEQIQLARAILKQWNAERSDKDQDIMHDAARLAELVLALDKWISGGGFLPEVWKR